MGWPAVGGATRAAEVLGLLTDSIHAERLSQLVSPAPADADIATEADGMATVPLAGSSLTSVLHFCANIQDWPYVPNHAYKALD